MSVETPVDRLSASIRRGANISRSLPATRNEVPARPGAPRAGHGGRGVCRFDGPVRGFKVTPLAFAPEGKTIAVLSRDVLRLIYAAGDNEPLTR